jgi:hypothetical protein
MSTTRLSVPTAVASIVTRNQAVYECLKQRIINYHALSANIKSEVESLTGRPARINTIVVALLRFSETIPKVSKPKRQLILREARITLASDVVDVTIKANKSELFQIVKRLAELSSTLNESAHLFQLSNSIKLIADEREYDSMIRPSLDRIHIVRETTQLARLDIHLSPDVENTPEFGFFLTELLYRHGIKIRHTYIGEETVLILERDDGPIAYEILRREIDKSRNALVEQRVAA